MAEVVREGLERTADDVAGRGGWDAHSGYGRINAANLLAAAFRPAAGGGIRGQVTDVSGAPVPGALVSAGGASATTGADGMYRLANLALVNSPYTLSVQAGGAAYRSAPVVLAAGGDSFVDVATTAAAAAPPPPAPQPVVNGGFESGTLAPWLAGGGSPTPSLSRTRVHTGSLSAYLGSSSGREPTGDSSLRQTIHVAIPAGARSATLSFWTWTASTDLGAFDYQESQLRPAGGTPRSLFKGAANSLSWQQTSADVTAYNGGDVEIYFNVHQDGGGDPTWMYVDDVAVTYS